ncbi:helix-turn-helix domain-containing protein [Vibrio hangzhouensis]|uniref:helix-turn-helix domain-containing protein n=1 Tax=Vibrio hangzhouensis TaxID=462991 RepID=UPI001C965D9E|nr:AraC family transcriptional regulator [Vibrio hangzhouensis]MBY6196592.1 AraC family transcriptional regulator [Vibrio hangzhouensis]
MNYLLGSSSLFLPKSLRKYLISQYDLIDANNDVSVITEPNVKICFFHANEGFDEALLIMCLRVCSNLDKRIILLHNLSLPTHFSDSEFVYASLDIDSRDNLERMISINSGLLSDKLISDLNTKNESIFNRESTQPLHEVNKEKQTKAMLSYIEENFSTQLREQEVAAYCHLSVSHFSRTFHKQIGKNFRDYICDKRIELAKELLKQDREEQISSIAFKCGFNDLSYFSRVFKKKTSVTPSAYRNLHESEAIKAGA